MAKCQKCGGSSFILKVNEAGEEIWSPCECRIVKDREMLLESKLTDANIKKKFRMYTLQDYLSMPFSKVIKTFNEPQVNILREYINDPDKFIDNVQTLWIWGKDPNAGHTTLSIILGIALIKAGYKVRFFRMQNLLDAFVEFDNKTAYFTDLKKFDVYIVDDAFVTDRSIVSGKYTRAHLFNFIDTALGEDKHFIMTSDRLVDGIGSDFEQIRVILKRSLLELELKGSIIEVKHKEKILSNITSSVLNNMKRK
jgi:DNA replication protein DnaC